MRGEPSTSSIVVEVEGAAGGGVSARFKVEVEGRGASARYCIARRRRTNAETAASESTPSTSSRGGGAAAAAMPSVPSGATGVDGGADVEVAAAGAVRIIMSRRMHASAAYVRTVSSRGRFCRGWCSRSGRRVSARVIQVEVEAPPSPGTKLKLAHVGSSNRDSRRRCCCAHAS